MGLIKPKHFVKHESRTDKGDKSILMKAGIRLSCIQFLVLFILSLISAIIFENIKFESYINAFWSVAYAGILSSGVAYTLQIIAQKNTDPISASLIMSLESVFALIAGMLLLNQFFNIREILGSVMVFVAIILSQLSDKKPVLQKDNRRSS